jgi:hypothetical protein
MSPSTRISSYSFPFFLVGIEWVIRNMMGATDQPNHVDSHEFLAPTLAAVGISILIPCTSLRKRTIPLPDPTLSNFVVISKREELYVTTMWVMILALTFVWANTLRLSCLHRSDGFFGHDTLFFGLISYFVAIFLSEIREAL